MLLDDQHVENKKLNWIQHETEQGGRFEWRDQSQANGNTRFVMLNSDMALVKDLDNLPYNKTLNPYNKTLNNSTGECPFKVYNQLNDRSASRKFVREFADDNQVWLNAFGAIFDRMIRNGYDNINKVPRDGKLKILAEDWYLDQATVRYCDEIINYTDPNAPYGSYGSQRWSNDDEMSKGEKRIIRNHREEAVLAFANDTQCSVKIDDNGEAPYLSYYFKWDSIYDNITKKTSIMINLQVCCGENGAIFESDHVAPNGYKLWSYKNMSDDASFIGDDDNDKQEILIKHIIVWSIIGLISVFCIIGGILIYNRCDIKKRKEIKKQTMEIITKAISPGKDKKDKEDNDGNKDKKNKSKNEASTTIVDVKTGIMELDGCDGTDLKCSIDDIDIDEEELIIRMPNEKTRYKRLPSKIKEKDEFDDDEEEEEEEDEEEKEMEKEKVKDNNEYID